MEDLNGIGWGGASQNTRLPRILAELQGLKFSFLAGEAANAVHEDNQGPFPGDSIVFAAKQDDTSGVLTDMTATQLIADPRASGTMAVGAAIVGGNSCVINGKTYTAVTVTPTTTARGIGPLQFYSGLQTGESANGAVLTKLQLLDAGMSSADADTVLTTANKEEYIAAWSLALAITAAESGVLVATATLASGTVTIKAVADGTTTYAMSSGTNLTRGAATITGGLVGKPTGTITVSAVDAADYATVGAQRYTAVASTATPSLNQFCALAAADITVGEACNARTALMRTGLSQGAADAYLTVADIAHANNASAYLLAWAINARDGALFTATAAAAVVTVVQDDDGAAAAVLTSSDGSDLAVTGAGTLTVTGRGWTNSESATGTHMLVVWFKAARRLGQW